ncbi:MAG TPA: insulinase family protein, partial [bacterium]|nr:insulinase family protein [bacterium]
ATVMVLVGAGVKYETKEINGISHFLEHMFFKGTKKRPTTLKIAETLDQIGGHFNAFTGKEYTGYWAKVDSKHLDIALDWVSDIFLNSKIEEKEIKREKGVIIEEINMYLDTPMKHVWDLWEKLLYGDQPAGWNIAGKKETILKLRRNQFLEYFKNHYSSKNTIICVAGNINQKLINRKIKGYFKNIKTNILKPKLQVIEKQKTPNTLIHFKKTDQTHLCLGVRGYNLFHPKRYVQEILTALLGGFMSSRLWVSIRERKGLGYYVRTISDFSTDTGYLTTSVGVDNKRVEETIKLILREYKDLKSKKINSKELQKAKDYLKGSSALSLESSDSKASFYATQDLLEEKILTLKQIYTKIDKVTADDILRVSKDIFQPKNLNLALIGPFKDKKRFKKLLKI